MKARIPVRNYHLFLLLLLAILFSCRKHQEEISPKISVNTGIDMRINDIWCSGDTLLVCGGKRGQDGYVLYSEDQGKSWTSVLHLAGKSIYTIERDSSGIFWAGGEFLSVWRSEDAITWSELWLADQVPFHEEDRPIIRQFEFDGDNHVWFVGGENLGEGVIYHSSDSGETWDFIFQQHEYRDLVVSNEYVVTVGHGEVRRLNTDLSNSQPIHPANDFFTGAVLWQDGFALCSTGGLILKSHDGLSWSEWAKAPSLSTGTIFNDIATNGFTIVACGPNGIWWTSETGAWKAFEVEGKPNLYQLCATSNGYWAGSDNGNLYLIE